MYNGYLWIGTTGLETSINFDMMTSATGMSMESHKSLLQRHGEGLLLVKRKPISQVPKECWILSNCQRSFYSPAWDGPRLSFLDICTAFWSLGNLSFLWTWHHSLLLMIKDRDNLCCSCFSDEEDQLGGPESWNACQRRGGKRVGRLQETWGNSVTQRFTDCALWDSEQSHWWDCFTSEHKQEEGPFCREDWLSTGELQVRLRFQLHKQQKPHILSLKHLPQNEACGYQMHFIRNCQPHALFWRDAAQCNACPNSL